jgi:uncharacterized tellurite resistance protein B-like protein
MHIILGALGSIITILILLNRLAEAGIDLGGLNPFLWQRRRRWQKKFQGNPIYKIESPLDVTALLATATAKSDGDMSSEEKQALLSLFQKEFNMSKKEAAEMLISSAYLLGDGEDLKANLEKVINPSLSNFTKEQATSAVSLLNNISTIDSSGGEIKREFVGNVNNILNKPFQPKGKWD